MGHKVSVATRRSESQLHAGNTSCRRAVLGFIAARLAHAQDVCDPPSSVSVAVYDSDDTPHEGWYLVWVALTETEAVCLVTRDLNSESLDVRAISVTVDLTTDDYAVTSDYEAVTSGIGEDDATPAFWAFIQSAIMRRWDDGIYFPD